MYKVQIRLYNVALPARYEQEPINDFFENVARLEQGKLILVCFELVLTRVVGRFAKREYKSAAENTTGGSWIAFLLTFITEGIPKVSAFVTHI